MKKGNGVLNKIILIGAISLFILFFIWVAKSCMDEKYRLTYGVGRFTPYCKSKFSNFEAFSDESNKIFLLSGYGYGVIKEYTNHSDHLDVKLKEYMSDGYLTLGEVNELMIYDQKLLSEVQRKEMLKSIK